MLCVCPHQTLQLQSFFFSTYVVYKDPMCCFDVVFKISQCFQRSENFYESIHLPNFSGYFSEEDIKTEKGQT